MTIKAIETEYNGYKFRSRLEARWAVFFDEAEIKYEYEPEGFEINFNDPSNTVRYLPDFHLPDFDVYCEVKPNDQKLFEDSSKIGWMVDFDGPMGNGLIILGQIPYYDFYNDELFPAHDMLYWNEGVELKRVRFKMRRHGYPTELLNVADDLDYSTAEIPEKASTDATLYKEFSFNHVMTMKDAGIEQLAYKAARQARFEYGETPVINHE